MKPAHLNWCLFFVFFTFNLTSQNIGSSNSKNFIPSINLFDSNGNQVKTSILEGKLIGLYFSASWCGNCRSFTPNLVEFRNLHKGEFEVVLVGADGNEKAQRNYIEKYKMPWLSVENQSEDSRNLLQFANVYSLPSLVILSPDGRIITQNGVADINDRSEGALEYWKKTIDG